MIYCLFTAAVPKVGSYYSRPKKAVHYANVHCTGAEDTLQECTFTSVSLTEGMTTYGNATIAGVDCHPMPPTHPPCIAAPLLTPDGSGCNQGDVRLAGGNSSSGRVEVCFNSSYTPLCSLNETVASVICRNLGYSVYSCKLLLFFSSTSLYYYISRGCHIYRSSLRNPH